VLVETEGVAMSVIEAERTEPAQTPARIPMSREEYLSQPPGLPYYEWCRGQAIEMIYAIPNHQRVAFELARKLADAFDARGLEVLPNLGLDMSGSVRIPDLALVPRLNPSEIRVSTPPLVVVEVLSPSTRHIDLVDKPAEYAEFGVAQYWIVDLDVPSITVQQNVDGNWVTTALLDRENPTSVVEVAGYGSVVLNLNQIVRK